METGLNGEISPESTSEKNKAESASSIHEPGNNCKPGLVFCLHRHSQPRRDHDERSAIGQCIGYAPSGGSDPGTVDLATAVGFCTASQPSAVLSYDRIRNVYYESDVRDAKRLQATSCTVVPLQPISFSCLPGRRWQCSNFQCYRQH